MWSPEVKVLLPVIRILWWQNLPWKIACWAGDFMLVCSYRFLEKKLSVVGLVSRDSKSESYQTKKLAVYLMKGGLLLQQVGSRATWYKCLVLWMVDGCLRYARI